LLAAILCWRTCCCFIPAFACIPTFGCHDIAVIFAVAVAGITIFVACITAVACFLTEVGIFAVACVLLVSDVFSCYWSSC
jgi:hypothetical protein